MPDEGDCRHSGGGDHRTRATFQVRQRLREQISRGIAGTRVVVTALVAEAAESKRRAQMDRRYHGTGLVAGFETCAHRLRALPEVFAHAASPRAVSKISRNCPLSFKKASWP